MPKEKVNDKLFSTVFERTIVQVLYHWETSIDAEADRVRSIPSAERHLCFLSASVRLETSEINGFGWDYFCIIIEVPCNCWRKLSTK